MARIRDTLRLLVACTVGGWATTLSAGDPPAPEPPRTNLAVRVIFTSDLPDIARKHSLRLILHPHFGDLVKHDTFRTDVGLRYTLSNRLELRATTAGFLAHGLRDAAPAPARSDWATSG